MDRSVTFALFYRQLFIQLPLPPIDFLQRDDRYEKYLVLFIDLNLRNEDHSFRPKEGRCLLTFSKDDKDSLKFEHRFQFLYILTRVKISKNLLLSKLTEFDNAITNVKILCLVLFNVLLLL